MNSQATPQAGASASPDPVNLASESVAGEEDPGASMDMDTSSGSGNAAASGAVPVKAAGSGAANPGDEAAPGTPGTGENICRECGGSGRIDGAPCASCGGTGKVTVGVGGA